MMMDDAQQLLGFSPNFDGSFDDRLILEELSETVGEASLGNRTTLYQIRDRLLHYITLGQVSEGQARERAIRTWSPS